VVQKQLLAFMKKLFLPLALLIALVAACGFQQKQPVTIWLIGDSTMAAKKSERAPESGWGEGLKALVAEHVTVRNHAASGRSTLSFINENRWQTVLDSIQPGDFVIMQFGHNDQKENPRIHAPAYGSFQDHLRMFIDETRAKGAHPIVCSSIIRRHFDGDGTLRQTHGEYIAAAEALAQATGTPYVDMEALTRKLVSEMGPEASKRLFTFTETIQDSTHVSYEGAEVMATLFVESAKQQKLPVGKLFN